MTEHKIPNLTLTDRTKNIVQCPRCQDSTCDRIPRGKLMKLFFFWLDLKRYKCYKCFRNFYKIS